MVQQLDLKLFINQNIMKQQKQDLKYKSAGKLANNFDPKF